MSHIKSHAVLLTHVDSKVPKQKPKVQVPETAQMPLRRKTRGTRATQMAQGEVVLILWGLIGNVFNVYGKYSHPFTFYHFIQEIKLSLQGQIYTVDGPL